MRKTYQFIPKVLISFILIFLLTSCTLKKESVSSDSIVVLTSFYPMYIIAENVIGDAEGVDLENMAPPQTGCLHDYQLTAGDMKKLDKADIFIINGGGMESFIDHALSLYPNLDIVDTSSGVTKLSEEHVNEHLTGYINNSHGHQHEINSHFWILPANAAVQAQNICSSLSAISPENADLFKTNTDLFIASLASIPQFDAAAAKACVFNEAFEYFQLSYGMEIPVCVEMDENEIPSARELADIITYIKNEDVKLLIAANDAGAALAETIERETNAVVVKLDPVLTGNYTADSYVKAMTDNIGELNKAINGDD